MTMKTLPLAVLAATLLSTSAFAQMAVLKGADALEGWQGDKPGVVRHITIDDLQPPKPGESVSNTSQPVPRPDGALPQVPDGYKIELVADGLEGPRVIRFAPNGDLFVAMSDLGEVKVFHWGTDGKPEVHTYIKGLNQPYGIRFYPADKPEWVYIAESDGLKRYPYKEGDLAAPEGREPGEPILQGIPAEHHWTRDVAFSPDGKTMYFSVGSGSNVGIDGTMDAKPEGGVDAWIKDHPLGVAWGGEERRAAVLAFTPDGKDERYFATGVRNCAGVDVQPATGDLWCVVNERDALGDNVPFEYATSVMEGAFYGWPWFYNGDHADPRWAATPRDDLKGKVTVPDVLFQAHSAPLNIAFDESGAWGPEFKGDAFVAMHGSWNRNTRTGYKVVRLDFDDSGKPTGTYEDFVTGFVVNDNDVWGRPVGIAFDKAGSLFFSDDGNGTIWKVSKN
ncbi:MAG: PQQ-dependent sugar dehydrogenase [Devosia sp.]